MDVVIVRSDPLARAVDLAEQVEKAPYVSEHAIHQIELATLLALIAIGQELRKLSERSALTPWEPSSGKRTNGGVMK